MTFLLKDRFHEGEFTKSLTKIFSTNSKICSFRVIIKATYKNKSMQLSNVLRLLRLSLGWGHRQKRSERKNAEVFFITSVD